MPLNLLWINDCKLLSIDNLVLMWMTCGRSLYMTLVVMWDDLRRESFLLLIERVQLEDFSPFFFFWIYMDDQAD